MDKYRVGMKTASAAIYKLNSFELLAVSYLRAAPKEEKKKKKIGKKKEKSIFRDKLGFIIWHGKANDWILTQTWILHPITKYAIHNMRTHKSTHTQSDSIRFSFLWSIHSSSANSDIIFWCWLSYHEHEKRICFKEIHQNRQHWIYCTAEFKQKLMAHVEQICWNSDSQVKWPNLHCMQVEIASTKRKSDTEMSESTTKWCKNISQWYIHNFRIKKKKSMSKS